MRKKLYEFVDSNGFLIKGAIPNIDPKVSAKHTTDKSIAQSRQSYNWTIYNVKLQENPLEYSKDLETMGGDPEKFYQFLKNKGQQEKFKDYFQRNDADSNGNNNQNQQQSQVGVSETLLPKSSSTNRDFVPKNRVSIEEIKQKETLLLDKLTKIAEAMKSCLNEEEKNEVISYFKEKMK